jgi:anti-sigma regulatory factor (Ser/Thr protein kinase)
MTQIADPTASAEITAPAQYAIDLPSDIDLVPPLRQFIADLAKISGFNKRFCFRTEIIIDELATNAVVHGSTALDGRIRIEAAFAETDMQLTVHDGGGTRVNLEGLKRAVHSSPPKSKNPTKGRGLVIAQMLSDEVSIQVENGQTVVKVVKRRETEDAVKPRERMLYESSP